MKKCPRCEKTLFADLDRCYECLYDYTNPGLDYAGSGMGPAFPPDSMDDPPMDVPMVDEFEAEPYPQVGAAFAGSPGGIGSAGSDCFDESYELDVDYDAMADEWTDEGLGMQSDAEGPAEAKPIPEPEPIPEPVPSPTPANPSREARPSPVDSEGEDIGSDPVGEAQASEMDRRQDVGLFAEKGESAQSTPSAPSPTPDAMRLGVLVHWRGLEMTAAFRAGRLTIGRDRSNDIAIASFDVPPFAAAIEADDGGAALSLLAEAVEARLDGVPVGQTAHLGASQELDLYGARLSLVRLD